MGGGAGAGGSRCGEGEVPPGGVGRRGGGERWRPVASDLHSAYPLSPPPPETVLLEERSWSHCNISTREAEMSLIVMVVVMMVGAVMVVGVMMVGVVVGVMMVGVVFVVVVGMGVVVVVVRVVELLLLWVWCV